MYWVDMIFPLVMVVLAFALLVNAAFIVWDKVAMRLDERRWVKAVVEDASDRVCDELDAAENEAYREEPSWRDVRDWVFDAAKRRKCLAWWMRLDKKSQDEIVDMAFMMGRSKLERRREEQKRSQAPIAGTVSCRSSEALGAAGTL